MHWFTTIFVCEYGWKDGLSKKDTLLIRYQWIFEKLFPWRHGFRAAPLRLPGVTGSHIRMKRIDVSDGCWLVLSRIRWGSGPRLGKKNRSEEDLVTVRFDNYPSRVTIEGLGRNLNFSWVFADYQSLEQIFCRYVKYFLRIPFVYDRTQDGVILEALCLCTELAS